MDYVAEASVVIGVLLAITTILILKIASATKVRRVDPVWLARFSVSSYKPMYRLLSEEDVEFLKSQSGYEPGMERTLRAERRRLFRLYLSKLAVDFGRLHYALRLMVLHAPHDSPELAKTLIRQRVMFVAGLAAVRVRLALYGLGVGTVDVRPLVDTLETMRMQVNSLVMLPARMPAA